VMRALGLIAMATLASAKATNGQTQSALVAMSLAIQANSVTLRPV